MPPRGRDGNGGRSSSSADNGQYPQGDRPSTAQTPSLPPPPPSLSPPGHHHHHQQRQFPHTGTAGPAQLPPVHSLNRLPPPPPGGPVGAPAQDPGHTHSSSTRNGSGRKSSRAGHHKTPEQARYWNTVMSPAAAPPDAGSSSSGNPHTQGHSNHPPPLPTFHAGLPPPTPRSHPVPSSGHDSGQSHAQHFPPSHPSHRTSGRSGAPSSAPFQHSRNHPVGASGSSSLHRLRCPECSMEFSSASELAHHSQSAHSTERTYPCKYPGCNKVFGHRSSRSRHEKTHRISSQQP